MSKRLIAVKLTAAQWDHVADCVSEWGALVCGEAELMSGDIIKSSHRRGLSLQKLATKIGIAVEKQKDKK